MPEPRRRSRYSKAQIEAINARRKKNAEKTEKGEKWHWYLTVQIIGFLLGVFSLTFIAPSVLIEWWEIVLIILVVGVVSALAQFKYFAKKQIITADLQPHNALFISYNFVGVGSITLFLFFVLNATVGTEMVHETHRIVGVDPEYRINRWGSVVFLLENDAFSSEVDLRALPYKDYFSYEERPYIEYDFIKGLFGYKVKYDHRLIKAVDEGA